MNWFNVWQDFDKFTNQLRIKFNQVFDKNTVKNSNVNTNNSSNNIKDNSNNNEKALKKTHKSNKLYRSKETKHLEGFIDTIEKQLLEPKKSNLFVAIYHVKKEKN